MHSHAHPLVIAGQGTIGLEILEDLPDPDLVMVPVGGGGILAGIATAVKCRNPALASSAPVDGGARRLPLLPGWLLARQHRPQALHRRRGAWHLHPVPYELTRQRVESIALVEDAALVKAMRAFQQDEALMTEPASDRAGIHSGRRGRRRGPGDNGDRRQQPQHRRPALQPLDQ